MPWLLLPWSWDCTSFPIRGYWSEVHLAGLCQAAAPPTWEAGTGDSLVPTRTVTMGTLGTKAIYGWL